jgi:hypothetical protein
MRNHVAQAALSILGASPRISIVASVDHINAALLWDVDLLTRFNWLWCDATTYTEFDHEAKHVLERTIKAASLGNSNRMNSIVKHSRTGKSDEGKSTLTAKGSNDTNLSLSWPKRKEEGISSILKSFSSRQIKVLKLLCDGGRRGRPNPLSSSSTSLAGINRMQLLQACRRENFAKTEDELEKIICDPLDHKLIQQISRREQGNVLLIDPAVARFIEEQFH